MYSTYSTQLADRLGLTATQSSMIGMMGTIGVSLLGAVAGIVTDKFGPTVPITVGSVCLLAGYSIIYYCYVHTVRALALLALGSCLAGFGSTLAYSASIKTAAVNFPHSRGTSVALPIAAFGLSAFFFSSLKALFFPDSTHDFLAMLALVTSGMLLINAPFVKAHEITEDDGDEDQQGLIKDEATMTYGALCAKLATVEGSPATESQQPSEGSAVTAVTPSRSLSHKDSFLVSGPSTRISSPRGSCSVHGPYTISRKDSVQSLATVVPEHAIVKETQPENCVTTFEMFRTPEFWAQFSVLGLLSGSSQMYIYCCGYIVRALVHAQATPDLGSIQPTQALQVGLVSVFSFVGRMLSGSFSDILAKRMGRQRLWMVFFASSLGLVGQLSLLFVTEARHLWISSVIVGLAYGLTFGCFPTIVCDTFGITHLSKNWGFVAISPVFTVYVFNLIFGRVYDQNSVVDTVGIVEAAVSSVCLKGQGCYSSAFEITSWVSVFTLGVILWMIYTEKHQPPQGKSYLFIVPHSE